MYPILRLHNSESSVASIAPVSVNNNTSISNGSESIHKEAPLTLNVNNTNNDSNSEASTCKEEANENALLFLYPTIVPRQRIEILQLLTSHSNKAQSSSKHNKLSSSSSSAISLSSSSSLRGNLMKRKLNNSFGGDNNNNSDTTAIVNNTKRIKAASAVAINPNVFNFVPNESLPKTTATTVSTCAINTNNNNNNTNNTNNDNNKQHNNKINPIKRNNNMNKKLPQRKCNAIGIGSVVKTPVVIWKDNDDDDNKNMM